MSWLEEEFKLNLNICHTQQKEKYALMKEKLKDTGSSEGVWEENI